jgi:serine/threonine protein kinase
MERFQLIKELGRGNFGVTYLAYDKKLKTEVAVKAIDIKDVPGHDINAIQKEINILKKLSSKPNCKRYIVCYIDSFETTFHNKPTAMIVSEYIKGISLTYIIEHSRNELIPTVIWPLFLQLIVGLRQIHDFNYAHRDIKPENILMTDDNVIKYIDFGLSCFDDCTYPVGTPVYFPPEYYLGISENSLAAAQAHDIWSLGVVFYQMANGKYPFQFDEKDQFFTQEQLAQNITSAVQPPFFSKYKQDDGRTDILIHSMLIKNWKQRPNIEACVALFYDLISSKPLFKSRKNQSI